MKINLMAECTFNFPAGGLISEAPEGVIGLTNRKRLQTIRKALEDVNLIADSIADTINHKHEDDGLKKMLVQSLDTLQDSEKNLLKAIHSIRRP